MRECKHPPLDTMLRGVISRGPHKGRRVWVCSVCKKHGVWGRSWSSWGNLAGECPACGHDIPHAVVCSKECMEAYEAAMAATTQEGA